MEVSVDLPQPKEDHRFGRCSSGFGDGHDNYKQNKPNYKEQMEDRSRVYKLGFKKLEGLAYENCDDLVLKLANDRTGFSQLLDGKLDYNYIVLVVKVLAKMCTSAFVSNKSTVMAAACKLNFVDQLKSFVLSLPIHSPADQRRATYFWKDEECFWKDLITYCEAIINTIPSVACDVLPSLLKGITYTTQNMEVTGDVAKKFDELQQKLEMHKAEMERKNTETKKRGAELEPPNDFREMSVYPTSLEIILPNRPFVRENIAEGSYKSVNHYLDVQFRLLREDFVSPLRNGICKFLKKRGEEKLQNIRIYPKVQFLRFELVNASRGVVVQFLAHGKRTNFKQENSRRFMFGSLVCFTKDNFATLLFGKILKRDDDLLKAGQVIVKFEGGVNALELFVDYLMIESKIYFEPYYHILKALQSMSEQNFPMAQYLLYVDAAQRKELPGYYQDEKLLQIGDVSTQVDDVGTWPSAEKLGLNDSQYSAFVNALTQKFVIIQGPPGTGKTYLGLRIAKTLIENASLWQNTKTAMLVVCYTNHALDQFLEGLTDKTKSIVRVGGQSKNEQLKQFAIKNLRMKLDLRHAGQELRRKELEVQEKSVQIKNFYASLDATKKYEGIIEFSHFLNFVPDLRGTWFEKATNEQITMWLLRRWTQENRYQEAAQFATEQQEDDTAYEEKLDGDNAAMFDGVNRAENRIDLDDDFETSVDLNVRYALKLEDVMNFIKVARTDLQRIKRDNVNRNVKQWKLENDLRQAQSDFQYLAMRLREGLDKPVHYRPKNVDLQAPHRMAPHVRWMLYFYCLRRYREGLIRQLADLENRYLKLYQTYEEVRDINDFRIMRDHVVVGMTTTSAARLQTTLQALKCPIVIVEEAAEILESHVIASLTNHCQHLILIGDHRQLRPTTADFNMDRKYLLGISLFERMVKNKVECNTLEVQHRMRPEIAELIVPAIYPKLDNHPSVYNFPPVRGVDSCLYFVTHENKEEISGDGSKSNPFEAEFLIQLARYLILAGYAPEDVTILAAYSYQMFTLWKEQKKFDVLKDVRISVLDNYQGEESRIVLLSMVRNNDEQSIGFLSLENRVCVALSRAREGFYMMGNIDLLCANSQIWPKIRTTLALRNCIGSSLHLRCQIHSETVTEVKTPQDFLQVSEGGCSKICGQVLKCGHTCVMQCHMHGRDHKLYMCKEKCERKLCENGHGCPKLCGTACWNCIVLVTKLLPCGHTQDMPCYMAPIDFSCPVIIEAELPCKHKVDNKPCCKDVNTFPCPFPCDTRVDKCGHSCRLTCHVIRDPDHLEYKCLKPCARYNAGCTTQTEEHACKRLCSEQCFPCDINVKRKRAVCSHVFNVQCSVDVDEVVCKKPCKRILDCGHLCKLLCFENCGYCAVQVQKTVPTCNHTIIAACSVEPKSFLCRVLVDSPITGICGHSIKIPCNISKKALKASDEELLQYCREPCRETLECEHKCMGMCSECHQGRIHKTCEEKCGNILVCGHKCTIPCRNTCQPCKKQCLYMCRHSKCKKKCGEPCTPCREYCGRRCVHVKCKAKCGSKCKVPPCNVHCTKKLKCGHACVGFCGDPCPRLCLICNKQELVEDFCLGYEEEEGARFVLLKECGHIIESKGMEEWLKSGNNQINVKRCPKCNTPLTCTERYSDYIKDSITNITKVKRIFYGTFKDNEAARFALLNKLKNIFQTTQLKKVSAECRRVHNVLDQGLESRRQDRRQPLNNLLAKTFTSKIQIYGQICELFDKGKVTIKSKKCIAYINFLLIVLIKQKDRITNQEINDFERELKRLRRMLQLSEIEERFSFDELQSNPKLLDIHMFVTNEVYSSRKYAIENDDKIKGCLSELAEAVPSGHAVTDGELRQIVKAVGLRVGHWYKCPNGHPYAIGECGGAVTLSKCAECKAPIGGQQHRLMPSNSRAVEVETLLGI